MRPISSIKGRIKIRWALSLLAISLAASCGKVSPGETSPKSPAGAMEPSSSSEPAVKAVPTDLANIVGGPPLTPATSFTTVRGTRTWVACGTNTYGLAEITELAIKRVCQEAPEVVPSRLWVDLFFQANEGETFMEAIVGEGIGKPCWIITIDHHLKIVTFRRSFGRG